MVLVVFGII